MPWICAVDGSLAAVCGKTCGALCTFFLIFGICIAAWLKQQSPNETHCSSSATLVAEQLLQGSPISPRRDYLLKNDIALVEFRGTSPLEVFASLRELPETFSLAGHFGPLSHSIQWLLNEINRVSHHGTGRLTPGGGTHVRCVGMSVGQLWRRGATAPRSWLGSFKVQPGFWQ